MSHPARERADGFHPLTVQQLCLQYFFRSVMSACVPVMQ